MRCKGEECTFTEESIHQGVLILNACAPGSSVSIKDMDRTERNRQKILKIRVRVSVSLS